MFIQSQGSLFLILKQQRAQIQWRTFSKRETFSQAGRDSRYHTACRVAEAEQVALSERGDGNYSDEKAAQNGHGGISSTTVLLKKWNL